MSSIKELSGYGKNCGNVMSVTEVWGTLYQEIREKSQRRIKGGNQKNKDNDSFINK